MLHRYAEHDVFSFVHCTHSRPAPISHSFVSSFNSRFFFLLFHQHSCFLCTFIRFGLCLLARFLFIIFSVKRNIFIGVTNRSFFYVIGHAVKCHYHHIHFHVCTQSHILWLWSVCKNIRSGACAHALAHPNTQTHSLARSNITIKITATTAAELSTSHFTWIGQNVHTLQNWIELNCSYWWPMAMCILHIRHIIKIHHHFFDDVFSSFGQILSSRYGNLKCEYHLLARVSQPILRNFFWNDEFIPANLRLNKIAFSSQ